MLQDGQTGNNLLICFVIVHPNNMSIVPIRNTTVSLLVILAFAFSCKETATPPDPGDGIDHGEDLTVQDITVNAENIFQKMDGIGANAYAFPYANDVNWSWNSVKFVFDELDLRYIRLASWTQFE
jgi:hypothetical protein